MKKILFVAFLTVAAASVHASWLYWQVDDTASSNIAYSYAKIKVSGNGVDEDTYLSFATVDDNPVYEMARDNDDGTDATGAIAASYVDLGTYSSSAYSFAIELFSGDGTRVGWTDPENYSRLPVYINMETGGVSSSWKPSVVPEPATALLLVLGASILVCRRRVA